MAFSNVLVGGVVFVVTYAILVIMLHKELIKRHQKAYKELLKEYVKSCNDYKQLVLSLNKKK